MTDVGVRVFMEDGSSVILPIGAPPTHSLTHSLTHPLAIAVEPTPGQHAPTPSALTPHAHTRTRTHLRLPLPLTQVCLFLWVLWCVVKV